MFLSHLRRRNAYPIPFVPVHVHAPFEMYVNHRSGDDKSEYFEYKKLPAR